MNSRKLFTQSVIAMMVSVAVPQAYSAGFQLNEFSTSGLGRAYSGEGAVADNAASVSRNPATIMMFDKPTLSAGAVYIQPDVSVFGHSPAGGSTDATNIAPNAWVPNLHFVAPINDAFGWGISATSNYGLATEFNDNYRAGSIGGKTDLQTLNLNLSGAYRLNSHWSAGLGIDAVYAKAKIERYAGDLGKILVGSGKVPAPYAGAVGTLPADTQITHLDGNKWGFGWNAGLLYELDKNNRYALTYRSEVKVDFDGNYRSNLPASLNPLLGQYGLYGTNGATLPGALSLHLPEMWEVSGYNKVAARWAIHYSLAYTSWSQFKSLKATGSSGQTLFEKDEGFKDAYRLALGTTYYMDDNWTFRTGIAFDDSPVPANKRSISIPDQDRLWLSAGTTYAFNPDTSVDIGLSYMHGKHVNIEEGPYTFRSEGQAWLYGVNLNYTF